jgi:hypothetical protein
MRLVTSAAAFMLFTGAQAQDGVPANVNDCTFLNNPVELRNCIDSFEQWRPRTVLFGDMQSGSGPDVTGSIVPPPKAMAGKSFRAGSRRTVRFKLPLTLEDKTRIEQIGRGR